MRPAPEVVIDTALSVLKELSEEVHDSASLGRIHALEVLLTLLAKHWDTSAARRLSVIDHYRLVLSRGAEIVEEPMHSMLTECLNGDGVTSSDLSISALEARLDLLRAAVIPLQAWLETKEEPIAAQILTDVWRTEGEDAAGRIGFEHLY